jgi:hypothetical protein
MCAKQTEPDLPAQEESKPSGPVKVKAGPRFHLRRHVTFGDDLSLDDFKKLRAGKSVSISRACFDKNQNQVFEEA